MTCPGARLIARAPGDAPRRWRAALGGEVADEGRSQAERVAVVTLRTALAGGFVSGSPMIDFSSLVLPELPQLLTAGILGRWSVDRFLSI
jgi:hypothetical protein